MMSGIAKLVHGFGTRSDEIKFNQHILAVRSEGLGQTYNYNPPISLSI